jgi:hypothetical protein
VRSHIKRYVAKTPIKTQWENQEKNMTTYYKYCLLK